MRMKYTRKWNSKFLLKNGFFILELKNRFLAQAEPFNGVGYTLVCLKESDTRFRMKRDIYTFPLEEDKNYGNSC